MTNLYEFLREIHAQLTAEFERQGSNKNADLFAKLDVYDLQWLNQYLAKPDVEIHFKGKKVDLNDGDEPVMASDWVLSGEGVEVFELLTEAMLLNANFAETVMIAAKFYAEHVPECPDCQARQEEAADRGTDWTLKPHKKIEV